VKVLVAYTGKTLRIVWTEAGGKCCICRVLVLTPGTETDDPSVFGELAHIIAKNPGGPRAGGLDPDQLDSHGNLMLLCNTRGGPVGSGFCSTGLARRLGGGRDSSAPIYGTRSIGCMRRQTANHAPSHATEV
jgi:hypothetical protein